MSRKPALATNPLEAGYTADPLVLFSNRLHHFSCEIMADFNKYDPRVDSLVIETQTIWDSAIGKLSEADQSWLATAVHRSPNKASKVEYNRAHTGFTRTITVTVADIERLYDEKLSS